MLYPLARGAGSDLRLPAVDRSQVPLRVPDELARQLLEYDQPGHTALVGIDVDARRAVLYHERDRYTIVVSIGADGLADGGAKIAGFDYGPGVESWVQAMRAYWG